MLCKYFSSASVNSFARIESDCTSSDGLSLLSHNNFDIGLNDLSLENDVWYIETSNLYFNFSYKVLQQATHNVQYTIIRLGFCDIQNNQGLSKGYQSQLSALADIPYLDLDILQKPHPIIAHNQNCKKILERDWLSAAWFEH